MSAQPQTPAGGSAARSAARGPSAEQLARMEVEAALGFAYLAAEFVSEPESWAVFNAWLAAAGYELPIDREAAQLLLVCLREGLGVMAE